MDVEGPKYISGLGKFRTYSLFIEHKTDLPDEVHPFTLKVYPVGETPSFKCLLIDSDDPTGYAFAVEHLNSWEHFCVLRDHKVFGPKIRSWLAELDMKILSEAIKGIRSTVAAKEQGYAAASRWLAQQPWSKTSRAPGRPPKTTEAPPVEDRTRSDTKRLGLTGG